VWSKFCADFESIWQSLEMAEAKRLFRAAQQAAEELRAKTRTQTTAGGATSSLKKRFGFLTTAVPAKSQELVPTVSIPVTAADNDTV
jgi:hypothetical protein